MHFRKLLINTSILLLINSARVVLAGECLETNKEMYEGIIKTYEQALVDSILEDGTIDQAKIPDILKAVASVLQPKIWNADPEATKETYERKIRSAWEEYERQPQPATWGPGTWNRPYIPWILIHDRYAPSRTVLGPAAERGPSPLAQAAEQVVTPIETMASNMSSGIETTISRVAYGLESGVARLTGREPPSAPGYDACHSACHSACVSQF